MTKKIAIISDVHANLEALLAVIEDAERQGANEIYCLGDLIGYGPNPQQCVNIAREKNIHLIKGNHEHALSNETYMDAHFTGVANDVIAWTIRQLNTDSLTYLERLPYAIEIPFDAIGVHASLDYPERFFYMLPKNSGVRHLLKTFGSLDDERVCFTGHTHLEAAYSCSPLWIKLRSYFGLINWVAQHAGMNNPIGYSGRIDDNQSFPIDGSLKYVFEVGTVGWHRKPKEEKGTDLLNNPATYVTYDGNTVTYRRVKYDFVSTLRKIEGMGLSKSDTTQLVDKLRGG